MTINSLKHFFVKCNNVLYRKLSMFLWNNVIFVYTTKCTDCILNILEINSLSPVSGIDSERQ